MSGPIHILNPKMCAQDQYIEVTTAVPASSSLYGLGEFTSSTGLRLRRDGLPRALWTRDQTAASADINTYGAWPFVMEVRPGAHCASPRDPCALVNYC